MSTSEGEKTSESEDAATKITKNEKESSSSLNGVDEASCENTKVLDDSEEIKMTENEQESDPPPVKKRKLNDSGELSDDSSSTEFLGFPDTRTEEEKNAAAVKKEKQERVKMDLFSFDTETFGKGKRSRVPNKKYEGLADKVKLSKSSSRHSDLEENDEDILSSPRTKTHTNKKQKVDMSNPNYLKPFELGWKRELVYRATVDASMRRNGDTYYYSPTGKKIRSMRELIDLLKADKGTELTAEDFTFFKEPVGVNDPEKEIIREAKYKSAAKKSRISSPRVAASELKSTKSPRLGGFKVKMPGTSKLNQSSTKKETKRASNDSEMEIGMLPPAWSPKKTTTKSAYNSPVDAKPCRPCSIRCIGVSGLIPTLQCRLCLCLYHKECVGELSDDVPGGYVCKNCQLDNQDKIESTFDLPVIGPPPLTPISSLKSNNIQSPTPPKLQRIPRPENAPKPKNENKSILGSVTTWFPPNSTLKMNNSISKPDELTTKPQNVVFMGERKFLVVPKGNVLSISPTIGTTITTPNNKIVTSPTADKAPEISNKSPTPSIIPENTLFTAPSVTERPVVMDEPSSTTGETKQSQVEVTTPKTRRSASKKAPIAPAPVVKNDSESRFMQNYLQNLSYGYQTLLYVFQYLKVQDLLRAGCVCTLWRDTAGHPSLWNTVRMKNSQVANWEGLADALKKHRTKNLDLRKMLLPNTGDDMWAQFSRAIARVDSLVRIELCRCPASVIEQLATTNKNLEVINAVMIRCESMDVSALDNLENLQELRLKSTNGFTLTSDLTALKKLTKLKHLSLTSVKDLHRLNVQVIGDLINLESLDLGECSDFPDNFGTDVIMKLIKLEKLRLEKGQGSCGTFNILEAVSKISCLEQLELVNFDVKAGFDKALGACANIKKLLIIPTYISQSATTNHMVLGGVINLKTTLSHFVWGVTLELLRVTELFVDQCEDAPSKDKKKPTGNGDSIPVLKPVPIMKTDDTSDDSSNKEQPQVEILPLPTLQKLLLNCLPTTRVKILKIPFHATWRQSIIDTVN